MELWNRLSGTVRIKTVSAEPEKLIADLSQQGYVLHNIRFEDSLTVIFTVSRQEYLALTGILNKKGAQFHVLQRSGIHWIFAVLKRRPILLTGVLLLVLLSLYIPGRIFFVEIKGNGIIPANLILARASECGIDFGASRRTVRSEKVKNALLESVPQLQWVGVNTSGCVAIISVRERALTDSPSNDGCVTNIVADRDAVIRSCTVLQGSPLCSVGQAVRKGELLVSGYTDCGLLIKATQADAEVIGETSRKLAVISPMTQLKREEVLHTEVKYYLHIGKNIIKFSKNSGIPDVTCVKMYERNSLVLPGGFQIPVTLVKEITQYYSYSSGADQDSAWLQQFASDYLNTQMIAGRILSEQTAVQSDGTVFRLDGEYICLEVIGRVKSEEILHRHE